MDADTNRGHFPETSWGLICRVTDVDDSTRHVAFSDLCEMYWPPLYAFARHRGNSPQDAEDLTQGFMAFLLQSHTLNRVDENRGRLRTFLLQAFKNYMAREFRHQSRSKRGGNATTISLNREVGEQHYLAITSTDLTPDVLFDRHWLLLLLNRTVQQLSEKYRKKGRSELFNALKHFLDDRENQSYEVVAESLGMSNGAVRMAVHRFTREYRELLTREVSQTLTEHDDTEQELQHLLLLASD